MKLNILSKITSFLSKETFLNFGQIKVYGTNLSWGISLIIMFLFGRVYCCLTGFLIVIYVYLVILLGEIIQASIRKLGGAKLIKLHIKNFGLYSTFEDNQPSLKWQSSSIFAKLLFLLLVVSLHYFINQQSIIQRASCSSAENPFNIFQYIFLAIAGWQALPIPTQAGGQLLNIIITQITGKKSLVRLMEKLLPYFLAIIIGYFSIVYYYPAYSCYSQMIYYKNPDNFFALVYLNIGLLLPLVLIAWVLGSLNIANKQRHSKALGEGEILIAQSKPEIAKIVYSEALEMLPDNPDLLFSLAVAEYRLKNYKSASELYLRVAELLPNYYRTYFYLGYAYLLQKNYEAALESFNREAEINPKDFDIYYNLAAIYNRFKVHEKVLENSKIMLRLAETPHEKIIAYLWMGYSFIYNKDFTQALNYFDAASLLETEKNEWRSLIIFNQAGCYIYLGNLEKARDYLKESAALKKDHAIWNLIWVDFILNKGENSKQYFVNQLENSVMENDTQLFSELKKIVIILLQADMNNSRKDIEPLVERLEKLLKQDLDEALGYYWLSQVYKALGETEKSNAAKQKALDDFLPPILAEDVI